MVEEACNAIVDPAITGPGTGTLEGASDVLELLCATDKVEKSPAKARNISDATKNNFISRLNLPPNPIQN
jgi:hypothetical protein